MALPQGFFRANPLIPRVFDEASGAPLAAPPKGDPLWPGFIRYRVAPIAQGLDVSPSFQRADWYGYCGPGPAGTADKAIKWLTEQAYAAGFWLYGEFVHIFPHSISYPWPTFALACYPYQAEMRRPKAYRATWNGAALRYAIALPQYADEGPEGRIA